MRIAMIGQKGIPAHSGGVEQVVDVLSRQLAARGHEVTVYCRRSYLGRRQRSDRLGNVARVFRPSVPTKHLDAITHALTSTVDVALRRADVVHYHAIGPAALAPLARLAGLPVVVTIHGLDWQRAKWGRLAKQCLRLGERLASRTAHELLVVSPTLCEHYARSYGAQAKFIPNGVVPIERRAPDRMRQFGLEPGRYLLAVARLTPEKGLHYLLDAYRDLPHDFKVAIAGGGGLDPNYERRLRQTADPRIVFLGPADRELLGELYAHARLFVLPSDLEGMSIALLEAMSMRAPVLVSDIPENTSVVGAAGFTFRAGDVADLRRSLDHALADPARLAAMGERGFKQAAPFQWPKVVDALEVVYARAARRSENVSTGVAAAVEPLGASAASTWEAPEPAGV